MRILRACPIQVASVDAELSTMRQEMAVVESTGAERVGALQRELDRIKEHNDATASACDRIEGVLRGEGR